jgi:hypothetical protein
MSTVLAVGLAPPMDTNAHTPTDRDQTPSKCRFRRLHDRLHDAVGDHETARRLGQDTLAQARRVLGDTHPLTRRAADNLAAVRRALGEDPDQ